MSIMDYLLILFNGEESLKHNAMDVINAVLIRTLLLERCYLIHNIGTVLKICLNNQGKD